LRGVRNGPFEYGSSAVEQTAKSRIQKITKGQQTGLSEKRKMMEAGGVGLIKKISLLTGLPKGRSRTV
jgi:hypothetical protein